MVLKTVHLIASIVVILGFVLASAAWGLATQQKAEQALERTKSLEPVFDMTCQLFFHSFGPQTKKNPKECEKFRPLTKD